MLEDVEDDFLDHDSQVFESLMGDANKPIYPGCEKFTKLSTLVRLYNLKTKHGMSDTCFGEILGFLNKLLPEGNEVPSSLHDAKKTLKVLGLGFEKIHACPNDCILYRKDFEVELECPVCNTSRWKQKKNSDEVMEGIPAKVLWYLPIIPRLLRLFRIPEHAKKLTWHSDERIEDGKMRHPADSPAWKKVDSLWPDFGKEARNL